MQTSYVWGSLRSFTRTRLVLLALCIALSSAKVLYAQANAGITGTVEDSTGAVVADAAVTITNLSTGQVGHTTNSSAGTYAVTGLTPGVYSVTVEASGFKKQVQNQVHVDVSTNETINISLSLGLASETVEVMAETIALNTTQPQLGSTIEPAVVAALPTPVSGR